MPLPRGQELFLLMEAATQQELLARMAFHDVAHRCLWRAGDLHGMETRAPWLAQVESGSRFDEWAGGARESLAFTLIPASLSFDGLWRHLRRFAKFEADGRRYFLRLGDPGSLRMYTASLAAQPDAVTRFFARGDIQQYYFHDPCAGLARLVRPVFESGVDADERDGCLVWRDVPREAA
ncbi:DUF4123 domain-containing protein [Paraburkholderia sp. Ac-20340]|uniref:DUF4123 domain-containing protein n=1 Tax=Paraburkholderia sp. Ac-20340 TaxID=2703888 RepID=UPI00197E07A4|nr:DUF4123 domain-containing protein [Paraburkholderia sp. Ac-20340]MBN3857759.1 DUF4123 domain-containing protein [Paraburkholderia sp. Ac-20340]